MSPAVCKEEPAFEGRYCSGSPGTLPASPDPSDVVVEGGESVVLSKKKRKSYDSTDPSSFDAKNGSTSTTTTTTTTSSSTTTLATKPPRKRSRVLNDEEKKLKIQERKKRNRESAERSRQRKLQYYKQLEEEIQQLRQENSKLKKKAGIPQIHNNNNHHNDDNQNDASTPDLNTKINVQEKDHKPTECKGLSPSAREGACQCKCKEKNLTLEQENAELREKLKMLEAQLSFAETVPPTSPSSTITSTHQNEKLISPLLLDDLDAMDSFDNIALKQEPMDTFLEELSVVTNVIDQQEHEEEEEEEVEDGVKSDRIIALTSGTAAGM